MHYTHHDSPVGLLRLVGDRNGLTRLDFPNGRHAPATQPEWIEDATPFNEVRRQLDDYFAGKRQAFDLPLTPQGTAFQQRVWMLLRAIPFGTTISYGTLATRTGNPKASRAVGAANGKNPISIIVPCHRVIGSTGKLTGFGGGVDTKRYLIDHEQQHTPTPETASPGLFASREGDRAR